MFLVSTASVHVAMISDSVENILQEAPVSVHQRKRSFGEREFHIVCRDNHNPLFQPQVQELQIHQFQFHHQILSANVISLEIAF